MTVYVREKGGTCVRNSSFLKSRYHKKNWTTEQAQRHHSELDTMMCDICLDTCDRRRRGIHVPSSPPPLPVPLNRGAAVLAGLPARQPSHQDRCALADQYGGGAGGLLEQGCSQPGRPVSPRQQGES